MTLAYVLLVIDVLFAVTGQVMLKKSVSLQGEVAFSLRSLFAFFINLLKDWHFWVALVCYGAAFLLWLIVLSRLKLSLAYPFTSLMYVLVLAASWYFFDERITPSHLIGAGLILAGILFITRTA